MFISSTIVAVAGCDRESESPGGTDLEFTGLITALAPRSLLDLESIEVTDEAGVALRFHAGGRRFAEFTPSHVREHMLLGLPVVVTYRESEGVLIIVGLVDAPVELPGPS